MLRAESLAGVAHGFLTRAGGVSEGPWDSLNCGPGSGDDLERVRENRARAAAAAGADGAKLVTPHQVHGNTVRIVEDGDSAPGEADALVTRRPDIAVGVLTADCAPVLFADVETGVVGAAHAGWRGALAGVIEAVVEAMRGLGACPASIAAAIGPAIGPASYEVDPPFADAFRADDPAADAHFTPAGAKLLFDLPGYVARRLEAAGVGTVEDLRADTAADPERFFSYRRNMRGGEPRYGRMLSLVRPLAGPLE